MKSFRTERVANEVRNLVSEVIRTQLHDPRIAPLTSVTRVEITGDLEHAKVHFSVFGDDAAQKRTMAGLQHARGFIQKFVARGLQIRQCPHLDFALDVSIKRQAEISALIDEAMAEIRERHPETPDATPAAESAPAADPEPGASQQSTEPAESAEGEPQ